MQGSVKPTSGSAQGCVSAESRGSCFAYEDISWGGNLARAIRLSRERKSVRVVAGKLGVSHAIDYRVPCGKTYWASIFLPHFPQFTGGGGD